jgi:hypothetical protein
MKQPTQQRIIKGSLSLFMLLIIQLSAFAREKVEVNGNDVGTWFSHNWMWVTGVVVLLLLIILFSGSKNKRKSTTVVKDSTGDVRRVTTTEVEE